MRTMLLQTMSMQVFDRYQDIPEEAQGAVVAIGNFDGVHRGHQILLAEAQAIAAEKGLKTAVLSFEPHPRQLFQPDEPPARITPLPLKAERLSACGMDALFSAPFDWDFASLSPQDFVQKVLIDGLGASHIVVGYDFCFGKLRKGSPKDIEAAGLPVTVIEKIDDPGGEAFSSSRIRQAIRQGRIREANEILGWDWEIHGEVVKGDQRGRELGYPTANMAIGDCVHPAYGVYASFAQIKGRDEWLSAATNIGIRPMFEVPTAQVETFIFDFDKEIYGEILRVKPVQRLRGEAKFDNLDDLIAQMDKDCAEAKRILI